MGHSEARTEAELYVKRMDNGEVVSRNGLNSKSNKLMSEDGPSSMCEAAEGTPFEAACPIFGAYEGTDVFIGGAIRTATKTWNDVAGGVSNIADNYLQIDNIDLSL
jgi:hypothetical protein